jgi:PilZ domain
MEPSRRNIARLSFSGRPAPRLETLLGTFEVVDLSPEGVRFRLEDHAQPVVTIGDVLRATLRFPADRAVEIEGRVLRISGAEAALQLTQGQDRLALTPLPVGPPSPRRPGLQW